MAINFLNTVDFNKNQLNNAAIQNLATDPATGVLGQVYYNTTDSALKICVTASTTAPTNAVWSSVSGDITSLIQGTYITIDDANGPTPTINHNLTSRTDTTSAVNTNSFPVVNSIATNSTGHVTAVDIKTVTVPDIDTTYDLTTAPTGTAIRLTGSNNTDDDVTISGTTGQVVMTRVNATELRVALTDDVTITDDLTVGGVIEQTQASETNNFASPIDMNSNKLLNVATGTAGTDGVNLAQVELIAAGVGVFQGSYNASTEPGVPIISGASNIALDQGDYFVVSVAGSLLGQALEPGDFIFADGAIAAGSSPAAGDYTFVTADANIAGSGATDGATQKGVAGFDSATFDVSANGWVQLKPQANPYGAAVTLTSGSDSGGETTFTVDITALFGTGALAANCKAEVVTVAGRQTVYPDITGNGAGSLDFKFIPVVADSVYKALITIV